MGERRASVEGTEGESRLSPREFLKARRPERFSDSEPVSVPVLDRSMLEYHLSSLTSRSQENDFARFALRLAEREVCPNLLPQTGPTGGGDSKVDSETYPVADRLSLVWYSGVGREASSERWAFAFSAKKDWRPKVRSDVAKIAKTNRGYTKAFFITNQFVPDKDRAAVEDKLRKEHNLDVRILDRTWILDKVFGNRHEQLAIDELRLATSIRPQVRQGPLDLQRERELAEVEARIKAAAERGEITVATVGDCLVAAELARGLDRSRTEVEGLYARAERLAKQYGTQHQQLECAYGKAWTAFWWYEDSKASAGLYGEAERLAKGSRNAYDFELLHNLWMLLHWSLSAGDVTELDAKLRERSVTLTRELDRLISEANRPSTSLQARTLKLLMRLLTEKERLDPTLQDLTAVIDQCEGLVGYPLEKLADTLLELGDYIGTQLAYGGLFEKITEVVAKRKGEVTAAQLLMKRGSQELHAVRPYEAIRCLGKSLTRLHKHESRHDAIRALLLCGSAYEEAGLFWAARGSCLAAASLAAGDFHTYSEITQLQAACFSQLKWLELRLGRVPQALAWHEVSRVVMRTLIEKGDVDPERGAKADLNFDAILGILFLRADLWYLPRVSRLPDVLEQLELFTSPIALLYALGYEDLVPDEMVPDKSASGKLKQFFDQWRDQPAAKELPAQPALYDGVTVELTSNVLGCRALVESDNSSPCVELAESVVAALESFVATGHSERVVAREPVLTIKIRNAEFAAEPFEFELQERDGRPHVLVRCREFSPHHLSPEEHNGIRSRLLDLLVDIAGRVFRFRDERVLEKLIKDELAIERAVNFTGSFVTVGNVLGDTPKTSLAAWSHDRDRDYPLKRTDVWDEADRRSRAEGLIAEAKPDLESAQGPPPRDLFHSERTRHTQMQTVSLIREALWERAGWMATGFLWEPSGSEPPVLALVFTDPSVAAQIFTQLYKEVGPEDHQDTLRVTIIRHFDKHNPNAYRVVVGSNPKSAHSSSVDTIFLAMSRVHTMTPATSFNLDNFLDNYARAGSYYFTYAIPGSGGQELVPGPEPPIAKSHLHVREAWQIGFNDLDCVGLSEDDEPIIPPNVTEAPVIQLFQWMRQRRSSSG